MHSGADPGRSARTGITSVFFVNGALVATWASRIPALSDRAHANPADLSLALLAPAVGALLTMPWVGRQLIRRPSAGLIRAALGLLAVLVVLPGLAHSVPALALTLFGVGAANAALDVAMNAQGMSVERHLGTPVLSSLHAAFSFGGLVGAGGGALGAALGIAPSLHFAVAGAVLVGLGELSSTTLISDLGAEPVPSGPSRASRRTRIPRMPGRLGLLGAACFFCLVAEGGASDWSAKLMNSDLGTSAAVGALTYAGFNAAMTVGRLVYDRLWLRWGAVGLLRRSGVLAAVGCSLGLGLGRPVTVLLGFVALGLGLSGVVPTLFRAAADAPGTLTGPALATVSTIGYTGFVAGPPIIGALAQLTSLRLACGLLALAGAVVVVLAFSARPASDLNPVLRSVR